MLDTSSRLLRLIKYAAVLVVLMIFVGPYLRDHSAQVREQYAEVLRSFQDEKKLFVADFLAAGDVGGPLDGAGLAALCASRTWFPDDKAVIVSCDPVAGGPGAVKNGQMNCIRFAIEVGGEADHFPIRLPLSFGGFPSCVPMYMATCSHKTPPLAQLVLPRMHTRHPADITNLRGGQQSKGVGIDYMFNMAHLVDALAVHCPQLRVHTSLDALYDRPSLLKPLPVTVEQLAIGSDPQTITIDGIQTTILGEPAALRGRLLALMNKKLADPPARIHWPVRANLAVSQFTFPAAADGVAFRRDFGRLFRVRDDARALAASALWNLAAHHNASWLSPFPSSGGDGDGVADDGFLAVHLRTEKDAMASGVFPGYDDQTGYIFNYLQALPPPPGWRAGERRLVYLATGLGAADDDVRRFRERAAELNATVVLKRDLLDGGELGVLNQLTWDQRALVDYEILLRAGRVLGSVESCFAWDVALRRAEAYGGGSGGGGFTAKPGGESYSGHGIADKEMLRMWADRYSRLYGRAEKAVSIYLGTWP